jgi:hypothetical protein
MSVIFQYGNYNFDPKPAFTINVDNLRTPDSTGYGRTYTISIEGSLLLKPNEAVSGVVGTFQKIEDLKNALDQDGQLFLISCNGNNIISGYPIISESVTFDKKEDNYARRADYKFDFEMTSLTGQPDNFNNSSLPPYVESATESWSVDFEEERMPFNWNIGGINEKFGYKLLVTHDVDVQGKPAYNNQGFKDPWKSAKEYAESRLGFDNEMVTLTGVLGVPGSSFFTTFDIFNQYRNVQIEKSNGSVKVTETFIVTPSGSNSLPNNAVETFNIDVSESDGVTTVGINGEVAGLANITYSPSGIFNQQSSKFAAASGYFSFLTSNNSQRLFRRADTVYENLLANTSPSCGTNRALNEKPVSKSIGVNPIEGTISYNYSFNTKKLCIPGDCIISQNISISDTNATDVFAEQVVLGRAIGPILQSIGTVTSRTRNVNIEMVLVPPTGCTISTVYEVVPRTAINNFISGIYNDLAASFGQVFVSQNTEDFNISEGRFTKSMGFTYGGCT